MSADAIRYFLVALFATGCARIRTVQHPVPDFDRYSSEQHSDFGVVYEEGGNLEEARRQYRWAVRKAQTNHVAWTNLGNVAARLGDVDAARDAWKKALELHPGYGPAVINLATQLMEEDPPAAERLLEEHLPLLEEPYRSAAEALLIRGCDVQSQSASGWRLEVAATAGGNGVALP